MTSQNRFFDDMAKMMSGAVSAAGGFREEAEARLRENFESIFSRIDLVRREEFNVVRDMAALARQDAERLERRIAELESQLGAKKAAPKKAAAKKATPKKAAPKKAAKKAAPKASSDNGATSSED